MKNKFWKKHSVFIALTAMLIPAVLIIARYSTWPSILPFPTILNGPIPNDQIPYDLAIGYVACYLFFLIQVEIPQLMKEKKAYMTLQNDIVHVILQAELMKKILEHQSLLEIAQHKGALPKYKYTLNKKLVGNENFPVAQDAPKPADEDGFYNFPWKANYYYEKLKNQIVFQNLNEFLIEQIIKLNITFWFQTYHSFIAVPLLQSIPNATIKVEDDTEKEKLKEALKELEITLGISIIISAA